MISFGITLGLTLPTFIATLCRYSESKWESFKLFILIDNFFICWLTSLLGLIGVAQLLTQLKLKGYKEIWTFFIMEFDIFFCIGIYRVLFKYVQWKNWHIVLTKIALTGVLSSHIDLAANFILDQQVPGALKEFGFIYVFGYFSLFY